MRVLLSSPFFALFFSRLQIAEEEMAELTALEAKRLKRMAGDMGDDDSESDDDDKGARKGRAKNDIKKNNEAVLTDEMRAAGFTVDPKNGFLMPPPVSEEEESAESDSDDEEGDDDGEEDEDDEDDEEGGEGKEPEFLDSDEDAELAHAEGSDDDEEGDEDDDKEGAEAGEGKDDESSSDDGSIDGEDEADAKAAKEKAEAKASKAKAKAVKNAAPLSMGAPSMPFVLPCPRDANGLNEMVAQYCVSGEDAVELVRRVRKCSAIPLNPGNR